MDVAEDLLSSNDLEICGSCVSCGRPAAFRCAACQVATYCSIECQRVDWRVHHIVCGTQTGAGNTADEYDDMAHSLEGLQRSILNAGQPGASLWDISSVDHLSSFGTSFGMHSAPQWPDSNDHGMNLDMPSFGSLRPKPYSDPECDHEGRRVEVEDLSRLVNQFSARMSAACESSTSQGSVAWASLLHEASILIERQTSILHEQSAAITEAQDDVRNLGGDIRIPEPKMMRHEHTISPLTHLAPMKGMAAYSQPILKPLRTEIGLGLASSSTNSIGEGASAVMSMHSVLADARPKV